MTIWINTFPKSGTALMRQALSCHGRDLGHLQMFDGTDNTLNEVELIDENLLRWSNEKDAIATAHLHYDPAFYAAIGDKTFFLIRDPRDVVVSHAHYVYKTPEHPLHKSYQKMEWENRLLTSIYGDQADFPNIADRFLPYLGWMYQVPLVRFEDVVEDNAVRFGMFNELIDGFSLNCTANEMRDAIDRSTSPTFRKGEVGSYAQEMTLHIMEEFDHDFGWLLDLLEYKRDE